MLVASAETAPLTQPPEHGLSRAKALSPQGDKGTDAMELEKTELTGISVTARGPQPRTLGPELQGLQTHTVLGDTGTKPMEIDDIDPGGDVEGWVRYPHCRYPSFTFSVSNPIFGSICTKRITVTMR